jgi:hypothetical protein
MSNRESEAGTAGTFLLLLGLIGGGSLLLCGCGIGAWLVLLIASNPTPEQWDQRVKEQADQYWQAQQQQPMSDQYRARAFLEYWLLLLDMKNLDEPYRLTSKAFQARISRQQFEDFLKARPYLKERDHNWSHGVDGNPGDNFSFMLHCKKPGDRVYTNSNLWVVREAGEWRVDRLEDAAR